MPQRIIRATLMGSVFGNLMNNVLHFLEQNTPNMDMQAVAAELLAGWVAIVKESHSSDMKYNGVLLQEIARPLTVATTVNWSPISGVLAGDGGPLQCALLLSITTNLAGKSNRGRIYIPGIQSAATSQGRFTTTAMARHVTTVNNLKARYLAGQPGNQGLVLGVFSRKKYATGLSAVESWNAATNITPHAVPATQRRRRLGHGI